MYPELVTKYPFEIRDGINRCLQRYLGGTQIK